MAADPTDERITDERVELMVSPKGECPTLKLAHFLNPSFISIDGSHGHIFNLPSDAFSKADEEKLQQKLMKFHLWRNPLRHWKTWVLQMHSLHQSVWRKAGIHDAIMNSINVIKPDEKLILALVEKWCPETNTFVFPWGEATITLEDMMVLGGYSVLGDPIFSPLQTEEMKDADFDLRLARSEVFKSKSKKVSQSLWLNKFMDSGSASEHAAFLSLWLSRFVFINVASGDVVPRRVLPIATHLARGTKIALAPAVLAGIYKNLSKLRNYDDSAYTRPKISSPFQLVQIWAWERFPTLQPIPNYLGSDVPRFYKWSDVRRITSFDVKLAIANGGDHFNWRPYKVDENIVFFDKIHENKEKKSTILDMDEVQEVMIRCVRASELVGMDCIEQYLPHRVAMQFGLDQDLPGYVPRANASQREAWENYIRPIKGGRLLAPFFLSGESYTPNHVTLEYWQSWQVISDDKSKSVLAKNAAVYKDFLEKNYLKLGNDDNNMVPPTGFSLKRKASSGRSIDNDDLESPNKCSKNIAVARKDEDREDLNLRIGFAGY